MTKLTDTQSILLSAASQRENGSLLPLPTTVAPSGGTAKAMTALLKHGFADERETTEAAEVRREEGGIRYGLYLTAAGATAIGLELPEQGVNSDQVTELPAPAPARSGKAPSKAATVIAMLERPGGATLPELIEATGWLPHTTRAALTGIRKKGHDVTKAKRDGATCYRIGAAA